MERYLPINDLYIPYLNNTSRYLNLWGSAGSGKSVFAVQKKLIRLDTEKKHRFLFVRKYATTLRSSLFQLTKDQISALGLTNKIDVNKSEMRFSHANGNEIILVGVDDVEKLKSIAGITGALCEEMTELSPEEFDQVDTRIRGGTDHYKQIISCYNPVNEKLWQNQRWHVAPTPEIEKLSTLLHSTFQDNYFIDDEYREILKSKASLSPNFYRVYYEGKWGKPEVQSPWAHNFNEHKHTAPLKLNPYRQIRLIFDFNINPFVVLMAQIWTDDKGHHIHFIDEIILEKGDIYAMCAKIKSLYPQSLIDNMLVTGDATEKKGNITEKNNLSAWKMVARELKISDKRLHVPRSNPKQEASWFLSNSIFARHPDVKINTSMSLTIGELIHTEGDDSGNILKKDRNKEAQRADGLDCVRYCFNSWVNDFIDKPGKYLA